MSSLLSERTDPGTSRIKDISGPEAVRLMEMGLTPGSKIKVVRTAPMGFPIEIKVRGYLLSLRESEAKCITLE